MARKASASTPSSKWFASIRISWFDRLAIANRLTDDLMTSTARMIVRFHQDAVVAQGPDGAVQMETVLAINDAGFATSTVFAKREVAAFESAFSRRA